MSTTLNPRATLIKLNNIPTNSCIGYGMENSGKVYMENGDFLFYGAVGLKGYVYFPDEFISATSIILNEVPCDAAGNILLKSHWIQHQNNTAWADPEALVCFFLCAKEPTHRLELQTGNIIENTQFLACDYLRDIFVEFGVGIY